MELIGLWIKKHKSFIDFKTELNPKYEITEIEKKDDANSLFIKIRTKDNYASIFPKNLNVITFAGKNGCGKSNLANIICSIIRHGNNINDNDGYHIKDLPDEYCLIWKDGVHFHVYSNLNTQIKLDEESQKITPNSDKIKYRVAQFQTFLRLSENAASNINLDDEQSLDQRLDNYFYYDRFSNDETTDTLEYIFKNPKLKLFQKYPELYFDMAGYEFNIKESITKLNSDMVKYRNRAFVGTYLPVSKNDLINRLSHSTRHFHLNDDSKEKMEKWFQSFIKDKFEILCFQHTLCYALKVLHFLRFQKEAQYNPKLTEILDEFLKNTVTAKANSKYYINYNNSESRIGFYNNLADIIDKTAFSRYQKSYPYLIMRLKETIDRVLYLENKFCQTQICLKNNFEIVNDNKEIVIRSTKNFISDKNKNVNADSSSSATIFDNINNLLFKKNYYKSQNGDVYSFKSLSTGEQRILKFLGEIYRLEMHNQQKNTKNKIYTYIFDEMDLSWHPEWQREMVEFVIDIFKNSKGKRNIIFTTHSPFLLSDMEKNNVKLLSKENGRTICKTSEKQTFAANIHKLLYNSFFLDNNIDKYAESQIQKAVKLIEKKNPSKADFEQAENIIDMIGEDIIKKLLTAQMTRRSNAKDK